MIRLRCLAARVVPPAALALVACAGPPAVAPTPAAPPSAVSHTRADYHIVPAPRQLTPQPGAYRIPGTLPVALSDPDDPELRRLAAFLGELLGSETRVVRTTAPPAGGVLLQLVPRTEDLPAEGYGLVVATDHVAVEAPTPAGLFYGIQTLRQLIPADAEPPAEIPAVAIRDAPRFGYRGMHLDVGRHFFPVEFIKRYIDLMAMYKMNTFHWHLTEDQGWRLEIAGYPRLTEVGSCRRETILEKNFDPYVGDGVEYCGFYTQEEAREIVAYARERYVTVIPEIEMPGHSVAALAAYPEYACTEGPFEVATVWGVTPDIYCPTEETFAFLEDVLTEVMDVFPGRYVHIGGDEAPKTRWEESEVAQAVIQREGLADEHELQSWFIQRIERFLNANGRRLIGWDEILEGGLAPEATVMSWRGMAGGIEAARQGHDVIMTPTSHAYFDYYQGDPATEPLAIGGLTPLEKVYAFEPVPDELTAAEAAHVLGAQGNVWTEYMATTDYVEYMVFPRLLALSEVVWSPPAAHDWADFQRRLPNQFRLLDALGVAYRIPDVAGIGGDRLSLDGRFTIRLSAPLAGAAIHYTTDGTEPTAASPRYTEPLALDVDDHGVEVAARLVLPNGRLGPMRRARFARTALRPPDSVDEATLAPGLRYAYVEYEGRVASVEQLADHAPTAAGVATAIGIAPAQREESYGLTFEGYLRVPESGIYTFHLASDDGSQLRIGERLVVDHDGLHGATERSGMIALAAGHHPITLRFFQAGGGHALRLEIEADGSEERVQVARWLFHHP